jgi:methylmalonyl-CoA mutase
MCIRDRRGNAQTNDWKIATMIEVHDEKTTNKKVLELLMTGCDEPMFDFKTNENADIAILFEGIEFEYIHATIVTNSEETISRVHQSVGISFPGKIKYAIDPHVVGLQKIRSLSHAFLEKQVPYILINGYDIQQTGATATQELAFCLSTANECLGILLDEGMNIDQAAACIHFSIGISANYFYTISKIRSLKETWASLVDAYSPEHACSRNCSITAIIGPMNKSLLDPYTNLLRQTTEGLSAAVSGADSILIQPYTAASIQPKNKLAERMATNISLLLKEESYMHIVSDPIGGSYAIEQLTSQFSSKAWLLFQEIEDHKGVFNDQCATHFRQLIQQKAKLRLEAIQKGENTLIGINKFPNPTKETGNYRQSVRYYGIDQLIIERELMTENHG